MLYNFKRREKEEGIRINIYIKLTQLKQIHSAPYSWTNIGIIPYHNNQQNQNPPYQVPFIVKSQLFK